VPEARGIKKPVRLKADMAEFCGVDELSRTEITKRLWDYIKANKLQTRSENGAPEGAGKFIVADDVLLKLFANTNAPTKSGKVVDLRDLRVGETIDMLQMSSVVGANVESS
jgi:chromatin remodeling complex protein RSC6